MLMPIFKVTFCCSWQCTGNSTQSSRIMWFRNTEANKIYLGHTLFCSECRLTKLLFSRVIPGVTHPKLIQPMIVNLLLHLDHFTQSLCLPHLPIGKIWPAYSWKPGWRNTSSSFNVVGFAVCRARSTWLVVAKFRRDFVIMQVLRFLYTGAECTKRR